MSLIIIELDLLLFIIDFQVVGFFFFNRVKFIGLYLFWFINSLTISLDGFWH